MLVAVTLLSGVSGLWAVAIAVPIGLAVWFLYGYSRRPGPEPVGRPSRPEEPFDDPVEAADRAASEAAAAKVQEEEDEEERLVAADPDPPDDEETAR